MTQMSRYGMAERLVERIHAALGLTGLLATGLVLVDRPEDPVEVSEFAPVARKGQVRLYLVANNARPYHQEVRRAHTSR